MNLATSEGRFRHGYERTAARIESGIEFLERRYTPLGRFSPGPFEGWDFLKSPAVLGFVALCAVLGGSAFTNSPIKLNLIHTWIFGVPTKEASSNGAINETTMLLSTVLVYGGLLLFMRVWLRLAEIVRLHRESPVKVLWKIMALWSLPMIVAPPLFSRDVFSYAAQGEMTSHHLSPYLLGPFDLGSGPFVAPVDPLWGHTPAPYGPFFLFLDGSITKLTGHHELATVIGLRLLEVLAVALLAIALPMLARAMNRDPGEALVLGALSPLVLLELIAGAHNDALMIALLIMGVALAAKRHPIWGLGLCACAAAVKAPAALGIVYVAWTWLGPHRPWREKIRPCVVAAIITSAVLGLFTLIAGFGFGWVRNLATPGTVRSWAAPATAIGLGLARLAHAVGINVHSEVVLSATRLIGFAAAAATGLWLLLNADRFGWVRSLGLSLLVFVVLGPVVQPWYLVWGLLLLATSFKGREHFWLLLLSITTPFMGLPGGAELVRALVHANPLAMAAALAVLASVLLLPLGRWTQWSWPEAAPPLSLDGELQRGESGTTY